MERCRGRRQTRPRGVASSQEERTRMRKLIVSVACALGATVMLSQAALAQDDEGERVCRGFVVHGVVPEVGERTIVVAADRARPDGLAGTEVSLRLGSRTRMDGEGPVEVGSSVKARGTVCQVDEADEPVFYAKRVKVKRVRAERLRGAFELAGTVTDVSEDGFAVEVSESSFASLVGTIVSIGFRNRTTVEGELAVGVDVVVAGRARIRGGESVLLAHEVTVMAGDEEPEPPPDGGE